HYQLMAELRRAAYTDDYGLPFVHAGIGPGPPLAAQRATLCGGSAGFATLNHPYGEFLKVVRGFDRHHAGPAMSAFAITLDGGCGYGGQEPGRCPRSQWG